MNVRQKAKDLIRLAVDQSTTKHERESAALQAVALIHEHGLLDSPLDGILDADTSEGITEGIRSATTLARSMRQIADNLGRRKRPR